MKTFKNKSFVKRDYEATNIVFCQAETAPNENWVEVDEAELLKTTVTHLYTSNSVKYFGWL